MPGKVRYHDLSEDERKKYLGEFYSMIALLKTREEVKKFFKDLLTLSEIVMISRRIQVAKMLLEGYTHQEIRKKMKVGFNNISQVDRWLNNGFGGYRKVIQEYKKKNKFKNNFNRNEDLSFSFGWLKKKYPSNYLLSFLLSNETNK